MFNLRGRQSKHSRFPASVRSSFIIQYSNTATHTRSRTPLGRLIEDYSGWERFKWSNTKSISIHAERRHGSCLWFTVTFRFLTNCVCLTNLAVCVIFGCG